MFILIFLCLFLTTPIWASEINLSLGETQSLCFSGKAWVEKSKIIQVRENSCGFSVKASKPGVSFLKIGKKKFQVYVLSPSQERAKMLLSEAIKRTMNLELRVSSGKVLIEGDLLLIEDLERLHRACKQSECDYSLAVQMRPELQQQFEKKVETSFKRQGLAPQKLMFGENITSLVGNKTVKGKSSAVLLKNWGIEPVMSSENIDLAPLVKIQITVAEVRRDASLKYGMQWPSTYKAQVLASDAPANFDGGSESGGFGLHMLENNGLAKILASPTILCRSGKSAEFVAGGEFPIKIINIKMQDVVWKRYGIILKVSPQADYSGKMSIAIQTEVSSIDPSRSVDQIPALFTNKLQSHFDLSGSKVIALSGLIKSEQSEASQGLPGLSRLPVLGALFSSKEFKENRTELVIFVKPEVVSPGSLEADQ